MKKIIYKTLGKKDDEGYLSYKVLLATIMKQPVDVRMGLSVEDIRNSVRVLDAIEKSNESFLELEDADYTYLKSRVESFRFILAHKNIITFVDDVIHAEEKEEEKNDKTPSSEATEQQ